MSTRLGSVRQTERHIRSDPPRAEELAALAEGTAAVIAGGVPRGRARATSDAGIAVAGTATSLAAIDQRLDPYDPARVHGYQLGAGRRRADAREARGDARGRAP